MPNPNRHLDGGFATWWLLLGVVFILLTAGCATVPYQYGSNLESPKTLPLRPGEPQVEYGRPNAVIDAVGWIIGIPSKIILLDRRVDNHQISSNTVAALMEYLHRNSITNVKVRVNQYAPGGEWSRLFRNHAVGAGWRYTLGVLANLFYTLLPGRIFGGDHYNPYTNTINLYSDHKAIAIHEGGHAKDFAPRKYKGTYAFFYMLPGAALYAEARASNDAISYLRAQPTERDEIEGYRILYPAYATYLGGEALRWGGQYPLLYVAAVVPGHILGHWKGSRVPARRAAAHKPIEPTEQCE